MVLEKSSIAIKSLLRMPLFLGVCVSAALLASCGAGVGDPDALDECLSKLPAAQSQCNANNGNTSNGNSVCAIAASTAALACRAQYG